MRLLVWSGVRRSSPCHAKGLAGQVTQGKPGGLQAVAGGGHAEWAGGLAGGLQGTPLRGLAISQAAAAAAQRRSPPSPPVWTWPSWNLPPSSVCCPATGQSQGGLPQWARGKSGVKGGG